MTVSLRHAIEESASTERTLSPAYAIQDSLVTCVRPSLTSVLPHLASTEAIAKTLSMDISVDADLELQGPTVKLMSMSVTAILVATVPNASMVSTGKSHLNLSSTFYLKKKCMFVYFIIHSLQVYL